MKLKYHNKYNTFYFECTYANKEIPKSAGFKWSANRKVWYTTDPNVASDLLQYADADVIEKIDNTKRMQLTAVEESMAIDSDIHINKPNGLEYMPFQKAGINYALKRNDTLIADEMGLGKTIQAIGIINATDNIGKVLIVCPASMKFVLKSELEKWVVNKGLKIVVWNSKEQPDGDIIVINYDIIKKCKQLEKVEFTILIGDEIHYCKSNKAQRSKSFYKIAKKAIKRVYLTGTPILNRPAELFYILKSLGFPMNWSDFMTRYANGHIDYRGYWDIKGSSNLDELQERLRGHLMVRRLKKDVLTELPDKIRQVIELPEDKLKKAITHEEKYLQDKKEKIKEIKKKIKEAKKHDDEEGYGEAVKELKEFNSSSFIDLSRVRHTTALKKVPYAIEHINALLESVDKIVVFAHHIDVLDELYKEFKNDAVLLKGSTSQEERKEIIDHFQTDPNCRLFISSIKAGGIGITLTSASTVLFVELDWTPAIISQAEDRCHRIGQENAVLVQHLVVNGSIDSKLAKMCVKKQEVITEALDEKMSLLDFGDYDYDMV